MSPFGLLYVVSPTNCVTPYRQDAHIGGEATGAMSWAFINALKKNPQQSYVQLLNSIRDELASKYTQKPQLSCSHPLSECRSRLCDLIHLLTRHIQTRISCTSCDRRRIFTDLGIGVFHTLNVMEDVSGVGFPVDNISLTIRYSYIASSQQAAWVASILSAPRR